MWARPSAEGPMAPGSLDREAESLEQKVFRDGGDQAEVARDPCEDGRRPAQCPTAAGEQLRPGQVRRDSSSLAASPAGLTLHEVKFRRSQVAYNPPWKHFQNVDLDANFLQ